MYVDIGYAKESLVKPQLLATQGPGRWVLDASLFFARQFPVGNASIHRLIVVFVPIVAFKQHYLRMYGQKIVQSPCLEGKSSVGKYGKRVICPESTGLLHAGSQ